MSNDNGVLSDIKVPFPDASYATRTGSRLSDALVPGTGLGELAPALGWAGRVQSTDRPQPFRQPTGLIITGHHEGGFAAGDPDDTAAVGDGTAMVSQLAQRAQLPVRVVDAGRGEAAEDGPVLTADQYLETLEQGKQLADGLIDEGADLLVLCGLGPGTTTSAIAVASHLTRVPAVDLSPRLRIPGGQIDDNRWMRHTAAIRDTFARLKGPGRGAQTVLTEIGGPVLATLTAIIVSAAVRRTPMLIDGPAAAAAALVSRDFSLGSPKWCYAPDRIPHPVVDKVAGQVGMAAPFGFGLDIGEGCAAINSLPILQDALRLANALPYPPDPEPESGEDTAEPAEDEASGE